MDPDSRDCSVLLLSSFTFHIPLPSTSHGGLLSCFRDSTQSRLRPWASEEHVPAPSSSGNMVIFPGTLGSVNHPCFGSSDFSPLDTPEGSAAYVGV